MLNAKRTTLALIAAAFLAAGATPASADGDIYSRLMSMKMMDKNHDGMVSKQDFLDMVGKVWDAHAKEMNLKGGKMTIEQLKEIQKILGRDIGV